jgi:hypothetical protein
MPVENTWSHQRRKRREMKKQSQSQPTTSSDVASTTGATRDTSLEPPAKREALEGTADAVLDSAHGSGQVDDNAAKSSEGLHSAGRDVGNMSADERDTLFTSCVNVKRNNDNIIIEMRWIDGQNRELMHQVMQYVKNRLK